MAYKIVLMQNAENDLNSFISYLLFEKKSEQAAGNLLNDFEATKVSLSHRYFMLYRIKNDTVYVDNIFHELQDYENKLK